MKEILHHDKRYIVVPATLIVPGVLNGSNGPIYYGAEDIAQSVPSWQGVAVTLGHPAKADGSPLSARSNEVFNQFGLGLINNPRLSQNSLVADLWIDVELTRRNSPAVLARLRSRQPLEISTGLNLDTEVANGVWANRQGQQVRYTRVARRFRPDHLAILVNQPGACSLDDGCGANRRDVA